MTRIGGGGARARLRSVLPNRLVRAISELRSRVEPSYDQDGLWTVHNCDFMKEARFTGAYEAGESTGSWHGMQIHWRAYVACWAANKAAAVEGDFVECGVNRGGLARAVIEYVDFGRLKKRFYLLDTFSGLHRNTLRPRN